MVNELAREWLLVIQYTAVFHWVFPGFEVTCEKVLEGHVCHTEPLTEEAEAAAVAAAGRKLDRIVRRIAAAGVDVQQGDGAYLWRGCERALYI
jgi:hypothetical protein